jgi:hypothetical protein
MRLKILFIANAVVSLPFGIGCVLAPRPFLSLFGATLGPAGAYMMQYAGAWLIGLGLLTWLTRDAVDSGAGRKIGLALLAAYLVALLVSVRSQLAGALNLAGWMPVLIQLFFVVGLGYGLFAKQQAAVAVPGRG